jgi:hypothetical protein
MMPREVRNLSRWYWALALELFMVESPVYGGGQVGYGLCSAWRGHLRGYGGRVAGVWFLGVFYQQDEPVATSYN